jgi:beta-N-acetylhexosaminidase
MKKCEALRIAVAVSLCLSGFSSGTQISSRNLIPDGRRWVEQTLKQLSLEEKIGQILQVRVYGDYRDFDDPAYRLVATQIKRYHIGSIDLGARMAGPNLVKGTPLQVAAIINRFQRDSDLPLLVGADIERGLASRLSDVPDFPFPMAFGAIHDAKLVGQFGAISAREARAVGIQWAFAPVADVNSNPANPIINVRSFGEDPKEVGEMVAAYIRGAHQNGLLVAVKHFPGHGDSSIDSHLGIIHVDVDRAHLDKYELPPFKTAIDAGADSVLLAHAAVPALDPAEHTIATTSSKIIQGLLRRDLGFNGLVVTDALEMRGVMSLYPQNANPSGRVAIDAIKAGADVLMLPRDLDAAFNAIVGAVHTNEISENRIDESVKRILEIKAALGLNEKRFVDLKAVETTFPDKNADELARQIADEAVTLVRSNGKVLPIPPQKKETGHRGPAAETPSEGGLVVISFTDSSSSRLGHEFDRALSERRPDAKLLHYYNDRIGSDAVPSEVISLVRGAALVVIAAFVTHVPGRQVLSNGKLVTAVSLSGDSVEFLKNIITTAPEKSVVVALGSPYLIQNYPEIKNYICTYSLTSTAELSAVRGLFGEIQNHGSLPVTIPGIAELGFSIPWPRAHD